MDVFLLGYYINLNKKTNSTAPAPTLPNGKVERVTK